MLTITRRASFAVPFVLAGCSTAPPPSEISAAIAAVEGVIADVKALASGAKLTSAQIADLQGQYAALEAVITGLQAGTTGTVAKALAAVTPILQQIGTYLPSVLAVLSLAGTETPAPQPPAITSLRSHYAVLQALGR